MKNDMKLVRRAKRGDVDAFAELYAGIYKDMYRFCIVHTPKYERCGRCGKRCCYGCVASIRKLLRSEEAFKSWIFRILSNKCKDKLREYAGKNETGMEDIEEIAAILHMNEKYRALEGKPGIKKNG